MPTSAAHGPGRAPVTRLALLALVLLVVVTTVVVATSRRSSAPLAATPASFPAGRPTAAPAGLVSAGAPAPAQSARPNIVTIVTDDMRTDDLRWMPQVRRLLAGGGLTFRNSFSPYPLCCPARASLLTGQLAHNHRVLSHRPPFGFGSFDDSRTLATSLNTSGYNTLFLGKYLNGYGLQRSRVTGRPSFRYVPPGWTEWYAAVSRPPRSGYRSGGTYNYWNTLLNVNGRIDDSHRGQYQTTVLGRLARSLVRTYHRSRKPFFLYLAPVAPHFGSPREDDDPRPTLDPATGRRLTIKTPARPRWVRGRFDREIPRASGMPADGGPSEADVRDKPEPIRTLPELNDWEREAVRTSTRQRAEALFVLDREVARLLATLRATDELDNTVVMLTSDNGYFLGEHRMRQGKVKPHEPSLRVPFLIAGKGIPRGSRFDPVSTPDLTATVLDLAGARPPRVPDGRSVLPSVRRDRGWRAPVVTEGLEPARVFRGPPAIPGFRDARTTSGVRTAQWKYVRYRDGHGELYDLDADPNELVSRFGDPRYAAVQARLHRVWLSSKDCVGRACRAQLPAGLQSGPGRTRAGTEEQADGVQARYGYRR
ncbi:MAG TPA: sulfatase [Nocardioidaceae bacterium]|nr:sulfatase [Nocardioidaceae bacterium]